MKIQYREFYGIIHKNEFTQLLYEFMDDNRDKILDNADGDIASIIYNAYSICGGIMSTPPTDGQIHSYIKYVREKYREEAKIILAIVWTILSIQQDVSQSLRPAVNTLRYSLDGEKNLRLMNRFLSSIKSSGRKYDIAFPKDILIIDDNAETADEAMAQARQARNSEKAKKESSFSQTLIFPNVEQFNNNPGTVINHITKK